MVDFRKLRESKSQPASIDPLEIFRRLPKPEGINDLYTSQAEVLRSWFDARGNKDTIIKLHTGGGKTLVGLLIAQSTMNETKLPVIYLVPNKQLEEQTLQKAQLYGINATRLMGKDIPDSFLSGTSVLITNYKKMFNGKSRFGLLGNRNIVQAGAIILDDAHASFEIIRESFTIRISKKSDPAQYDELTNMFRGDFDELDKLGTFEDIVRGHENLVLEVPYWAINVRSQQIRDFFRDIDAANSHMFSWPFIRDSIDQCHFLITKDSVAITPLFPMVDMIPTFSTCPRRIYMSATIGDDSAIIRTFDIDKSAALAPLRSESLAGVSERMILAPESTKIDFSEIGSTVKQLANWVSQELGRGSVALVPSRYASQAWEPYGVVAETPELVEASIEELTSRRSNGPFIFANRYDGMDLPGDACRLLIVDGLPSATSEYEQYRANSLIGAGEYNSSLAQRVEQAIGRGARGASDYCVVILTGKKIIPWIGQTKNLDFLTTSTRTQIDMGLGISSTISSLGELKETIYKCISRDHDWVQYHAETLAENVTGEQLTVSNIELAACERKAFKLLRDGYPEKAVLKITKFREKNPGIDRQMLGWIYQMEARITHLWGKKDEARNLQQHAYAQNSHMLRPKVRPAYTPIVVPGYQADTIVKNINSYKFHRAIVSRFNEITNRLVPESSASQFEEALKELGKILGFESERPEQVGGPDVLWLTGANHGFVFEAKSRKKDNTPLTKEQNGQLLNSMEWAQKNYPGFVFTGVSIHPNAYCTSQTTPGSNMALTLAGLNSLLVDTLQLLVDLSDSLLEGDELKIFCESKLEKSKLRPDAIISYMNTFEVVE